MTTKHKKKPSELLGKSVTITGSDRPDFAGVALICSCGSDAFHVFSITWEIDLDLHIQCAGCGGNWGFGPKAFLNKTQVFAV